MEHVRQKKTVFFPTPEKWRELEVILDVSREPACAFAQQPTFNQTKNTYTHAKPDAQSHGFRVYSNKKYHKKYMPDRKISGLLMSWGGAALYARDV